MRNKGACNGAVKNTRPRCGDAYAACLNSRITRSSLKIRRTCGEATERRVQGAHQTRSCQALMGRWRLLTLENCSAYEHLYCPKSPSVLEDHAFAVFGLGRGVVEIHPGKRRWACATSAQVHNLAILRADPLCASVIHGTYIGVTTPNECARLQVSSIPDGNHI